MNANGITVLVDQYSSYSDSGDSVSHGAYGSNLSLDSINSIVSASQLSSVHSDTVKVADISKLNRQKSNSLTPFGRARLSKYHRSRAASESGLIQMDGSLFKLNSEGNLQSINDQSKVEGNPLEKAKSSEDIHLEAMQVHRSLSGKPVKIMV